MRIGIIGAGLAGLTAARVLAQRHDVTVFEKSRGVGGRMSTRYAGDYRFDHGAQYFTARSDEFNAFLQPFIAAGVVQRWDGRWAQIESGRDATPVAATESRYVAAPRMTDLARQLAADLDVRTEVTVRALRGQAGDWRVIADGEEHGPYAWLIMAIPAAQAQAILPPEFSHSATLSAVRMAPCFALMAAWDEPLALSWDAALVSDSPLAWIAVNSAKPGRPPASAIVAHAANEWSTAHFADEPAAVQATLLEALATATGCTTPTHYAIHRWRYANTTSGVGAPALIDHTRQLAVGGDWCLRARVESAYLSGLALAAAVPPE